jgi:hypothetical protein
MPRFVVGYLDWEERLRTGQEADANSRTSDLFNSEQELGGL